MNSTRRRHRSLAVAAALSVGVAGGLVALSPTPSAAATNTKHVAGNFVGDDKAEVFEYTPGTGADYMFINISVIDNFGVSATPISYVVTPTYVPIVGDFDGDGYDEIFWYGGGPSQDVIWKFNGVTSVEPIAVSQGGLYYAAAGDFTGDGADDILWYAPGAAPDEVWEYDPGSFTPSVHPVTLAGDYAPPVVGAFTGDGTDDVIFYGEGAKPDYIWDFHPGAFDYTSREFPLTGVHYRLLTLDSRADGWSDIFFYNPGPTIDHLWNFRPADIEKLTDQVEGTYDAVTGDFFGDGHDDVFWFGASSSVWDWHLTSSGLVVSHRPYGAS